MFHRIDGRMWISGIPSPRRRGWIANLAADPRLTVHLKGPIAHADLPATARIVDDPAERRAVLERVARAWQRTDLERMIASSPLIEVTLDEAARLGASAAARSDASTDAGSASACPARDGCPWRASTPGGCRRSIAEPRSAGPVHDRTTPSDRRPQETRCAPVQPRSPPLSSRSASP